MREATCDISCMWQGYVARSRNCRRHGRAEGSAVSKWQIEIWASHDTKDLNGYLLARRLLVDPRHLVQNMKFRFLNRVQISLTLGSTNNGHAPCCALVLLIPKHPATCTIYSNSNIDSQYVGLMMGARGARGGLPVCHYSCDKIRNVPNPAPPPPAAHPSRSRLDLSPLPSRFPIGSSGHPVLEQPPVTAPIR